MLNLKKKTDVKALVLPALLAETCAHCFECIAKTEMSVTREGRNYHGRCWVMKLVRTAS